MSLLSPTPPHLLVDAEGRTDFLWDMELTLDSLLRLAKAAAPEATINRGTER